MPRPIQVGDMLSKTEWTQCAVKVIDKGRTFFIGHLFDYKQGLHISNDFVGRLNDTDWRRIEIISSAFLSVN